MSRTGGILGQQQLDNALEVMQRRIETDRLKGVQVLQRDLGKLTPVSKTSITSRLGAQHRQMYAGVQGKVAFNAYTVHRGRVVYEIHTHPSFFKGCSLDLMKVLYAGAMQIGLSVIPCPKGLVACLDDTEEDQFWTQDVDTFRRSQSFVPENTELLHKSEGLYQVCVCCGESENGVACAVKLCSSYMNVL